MTNTIAAKKALRKSKRRYLINKVRKSSIRTCIKKVRHYIDNGLLQEAEKHFVVAQSKVMVGVTKKVIKLNTASRIISKLSHKIKSISTFVETGQTKK